MNKIAVVKKNVKKEEITNKERPLKKETLLACVFALPWISNLQMYSLHSNQTSTVKNISFGLL